MGEPTSWIDLNQDGFADVAMGAPLEDGHRGALYLYHGTQSGVKPCPAQVRNAPTRQGHGGRKGKGGAPFGYHCSPGLETQTEQVPFLSVVKKVRRWGRKHVALLETPEHRQVPLIPPHA